MKKLLITVMAIIFSGASFAQTDSTKANGNWNAASTWKSGTVPTGAGTYIIRVTDSVYFSAAATITGTVKTLSGKIGVFDSSKVVFKAGSTYEHAVNGGTLPKVVWDSGSSCVITGLVGNAPSNGNQNFYNLTWNCPAQSGGLNLGMANNTIGGTVRIIKSNSQYFRLTAGNVTVPSGRKLITINGDVILDTLTAYFTSTGSSSPSDTFSVVIKGNINSKGTFNLANGSAGMVNLFVAGNITVTEGSFTTNSTTTVPDSLIFNGTTKQTFIRGGAVTSSNIRFAVRKGAIVDFDTCTIGGSAASTFTLAAGGTIISGRSNGFKGNINGGGAIILDSAANFEYDGTVAQADTLLPTVVNNLTINNAAGVTLKSPTRINGILTLKAGMFDNTVPFTLGPSGSIVNGGGSLKVPVTSVKSLNENGIPVSFFVQQNYPNPFNPSTTIVFGIAKSGFVSAKVFNLLGQEVADVMNEYKNAGEYSINFNASHLSSGVYLYRIQSGNSVAVKRMLLMK
ncbi:MAG TPA: hypothetical protein DCQ28_08965 [Bacteroidetes bacterium]|nr:hypothetical protein [Bacteroidota bacterium]